MRAKTLIQSVDRAIEILEIVRDADGPVRAAMIAHEMELPLKTAHNLIRSLLQHGYLVQNEEKSYQLGPECFLLADQAKGPFSQLGRQVGDAVLEFGLRRAQGPDAGTYGARAAIIGGCSSTSNVLAGQLYDVAIAGTHAHSWVMSLPTELDAFRAYADIFPDSCMLLVDTYDTLKSGVPNAIKVFDELRAKGHKPVGIRLDSGDLAYFSKEARRMLDAAGYQDARIFASSDLDEYVIRELKAQGARIDVWGVGTKMITSYDWPALGGVYKMSAEIVDGKMTPKIKISENPAKLTNPGYKKIYRLYGKRDNMALADIIALDDETIDDSKPIKLYNQHHTYQTKVIRDFYARELLVPVFVDGRQVYESPDVCSIREYSKKELAAFWEEYRRILNPHTYKVDISDKLYNLKMELIHENREEYEQEDC